MKHLLAIDTATDALSLALQLDDGCRVVHRIMPRQHQQQLFAVLDELTDSAPLDSLGLEGIAFGRGPGSFTGLRIATSAAQGLGYSLGLPVVGISTLETQARTLLRRETLSRPCLLFSTLDARIGQLYGAWYHFDGQTLVALGEAEVSEPEHLEVPASAQALSDLPRYALGSGLNLLAELPMPGVWQGRWPEVLPEAQDMLVPAETALSAGGPLDAALALPDYVQKRIGWKTLAEQGRSS